MEKFIAGMVLGMAAGALLIAGNNKARALVKKGQEELKQRVDAYIDQKLAELEGGRQSAPSLPVRFQIPLSAPKQTLCGCPLFCRAPLCALCPRRRLQRRRRGRYLWRYL